MFDGDWELVIDVRCLVCIGKGIESCVRYLVYGHCYDKQYVPLYVFIGAYRE